MQVLIAGLGRVGRRTARILHEEGHEVVAIEQDAEAVERCRRMGITVHEGDATDDAIIESIGMETVDVVAGLTTDLTVNFDVCTVGNHHGCRTVMRIDDDYREEIYQKYAQEVDEVIYPERLGAAGAKTALLGGDFNVVADLAEQLQMVTLTITESSPSIGERVREVSLPSGSRIYAHGSDGDPLRIPLPGTHIQAGDRIAVLAEPDAVDSVTTALLGER